VQPTPDDHGDHSSVAKNTATSVVPDLDALDGLAERPVHEHAAVYERVHAQLQDALSEIDDA
jgi:hypothetical protein